jgi:hypothetical protein
MVLFELEGPARFNAGKNADEAFYDFVLLHYFARDLLFGLFWRFHILEGPSVFLGYLVGVFLKLGGYLFSKGTKITQ